jgi:alpha-N-arabinofuranosidase
MDKTTVTVHTKFEIGRIDDRLFGGFIEHLGRCVYEGLYEPGSRHADNEGFRRDVLESLARLNMTAMRYPGGNFASGYHWLDGVGPKENRPTICEPAWKSNETNEFGTDEYIKLCKKMGWTPMLTVNLGSAPALEARQWVEYCNLPVGTKFADMRVKNGAAEPYGVKLWCLGNEMDGDWQIGHATADEYARRALEAAKMMKDVDGSIELVVCGSCVAENFIDWDRRVLEYIGDYADYISLHRYVGNEKDDTADYLAVTNEIDRYIERMDAVCRIVQARNKSKKRAFLSFDEWNVWYKNKQVDGGGKFAPHLLEEVYNLEDALVVAGFLNSFIRHADVVKIANLAQVVNVIAPLMTRGDELLIQSTFYPFEMFSKRRQGISLKPIVEGPTYEGATKGMVCYVDVSVIIDGDKLSVFLINRNLEQEAVVSICVADKAVSTFVDAEKLTGPGAKSANSFEKPDLIKSTPFTDVKISNGKAELKMPPLSVVAASFELT